MIRGNKRTADLGTQTALTATAKFQPRRKKVKLAQGIKSVKSAKGSKEKASQSRTTSQRYLGKGRGRVGEGNIVAENKIGGRKNVLRVPLKGTSSHQM